MNFKAVLGFTRTFIFALASALFLITCASNQGPDIAKLSSKDETNYGVLVMAHGGGANWNDSVLEAVEQLRQSYPVEVAFGMADAGALEKAVRKLETANVKHVGVVRIFISGESWFERTRQILGMQAGAPTRTEWEANAGNRPQTFMPMGFWQIDTDLSFHLTEEGLADAEEMDQVLLNRMQALSSNPEREVAMVLAHGPATDEEDARWISKISDRTEFAKNELGLAHVQVFTLREDWEEKREGAEERIRDYVLDARLKGLGVLVVPYRVQGFGPYAQVLEGLEYKSDGQGLLPHQNVGLWIKNQAFELEQEAAEHHRALIAGSP